MMDETKIKTLVTKHMETLSEQNAAKREAAIREIYATDVAVIEPFFVTTGHTKLSGVIEKLHQDNPGYTFQAAKPIDTHNNVARLSWQFGPPAKPDAISGQDFLLLQDGKIQTLYVFINGLKN
jgi:hypothetical protein